MSSDPEPQADRRWCRRAWGEQAGEERGDLGRACRTRRPSCRHRRQTSDQVFVDVSDHVLVADSEGRRSRRGSAKSSRRQLDAGVALLGLAELALGVEVHLTEYAFELGLVGLLDLFERDVDALADVGVVALGVEAVEIATGREEEALAREAAADARVVAFATSAEDTCLAVIFDDVADVFQEQHHEDVVLVVLGSRTPRKVSHARQATLLISSWLMVGMFGKGAVRRQETEVWNG
jgi:hypothetical protein